MTEAASPSTAASADSRSAEPPPPATGEMVPAQRSRRLSEIVIRIAILAAAGILVALFTMHWNRWVGDSTRQETDDAYVSGDVTPLSAQVDGNVRRVLVDDYQQVKKGDLLVEIDAADYQARVALAEAAVAGAEAAIANIKSKKAAQKAQVAAAEDAANATNADVERTKLEAARQRALLATTFGTAQKVEQAVAAERRFSATLAANQAALAAQQRQQGGA